MARLLIRVHDKIGRSDLQMMQLTKRGDVIDVVPDEHQWGGELRMAFWRNIDVPDLPYADAHRDFMASEGPGGKIKAAGLILDPGFLASLGLGDFSSWIDDDTRRYPVWMMAAYDIYRIFRRKEAGPEEIGLRIEPETKYAD